MISNTDRVEKKTTLKAPRSKVWRAIADAAEFGSWFGMTLEGEFASGAQIVGKITSPGKLENFVVTLEISAIEPESYFAFRWHPYAIDPKVDYSSEPTTLVEFRLEDENGQTALTIVESGFDKLPLARRAEAFRMNDGGWSEQMKRIETYVA